MTTRIKAIAALIFAVPFASSAAFASTLTGYLSTYAGPQNAIDLGIAVTNPELVAANNAAIASVTLTQTAGAAATPVISTSLPLNLGTIVPGATVFGDVIVDFTGADPLNALFRMNVTLTANGFTGGFVFNDLPAQNPCLGVIGPCVFPPLPEPTPLPSALPLFATALGSLGLLGWRRKRKAQAVA